MKNIYTCLALLMLMGFSISLSAQKIDPIKWKTSVVGEGKKQVVLLTASIEEGWHLYSQNIKGIGPVPTSFDYSDSKGVKAKGKMNEAGNIIDKFDPVFEMDLTFFESEAIFSQNVKLREDKARLEMDVNFMLCNDEMCLPPTTKRFSVALKK